MCLHFTTEQNIQQNALLGISAVLKANQLTQPMTRQCTASSSQVNHTGFKQLQTQRGLTRLHPRHSAASNTAQTKHKLLPSLSVCLWRAQTTSSKQANPKVCNQDNINPGRQLDLLKTLRIPIPTDRAPEPRNSPNPETPNTPRLPNTLSPARVLPYPALHSQTRIRPVYHRTRTYTPKPEQVN